MQIRYFLTAAASIWNCPLYLYCSKIPKSTALCARRRHFFYFFLFLSFFQYDINYDSAISWEIIIQWTYTLIVFQIRKLSIRWLSSLVDEAMSWFSQMSLFFCWGTVAVWKCQTDSAYIECFVYSNNKWWAVEDTSRATSMFSSRQRWWVPVMIFPSNAIRRWN